MNKISVYHINQYLNGGAAIAAKRLFNSLLPYEDLELKFYSENIVDENGYHQYSSAHKASLFKRIQNKLPFFKSKNYKIHKELDRYMDGRPAGLDVFSVSFLDYITPPPLPLPDIIHLHWIGSFLDYPSFFKQIPFDIPIVWTLHDMHPFTGGCHYSNDCLKFESVCESCPQLGSYSRNDLANYNFGIKEKVFAARKMHIVADSEWLKAQAEKSHLFRNAKSINCIHYGLDHHIYSPKDKIYCRNSLGISPSQSEFYVCFGANDVTTKRKGMNELIRALAFLNDRDINITCLVFGYGKFESNKNIRFIEFGNVVSEEMLSMIYNAADIFVMPSLEEAFGQTCLEAMSCALPVVAFNTGGIPDMIKDYETGLLANKGDYRDLAEKISLLLSNQELREKISHMSRQKVIDCFNLHNQASKYHDLYQRILN